MFTLDPGTWLEPVPRVQLEDGVVYGAGADAAAYDARAEPLLSLAWAEAAPEPAAYAQVFDLEETALGGVHARRVFSVHEGTPPTAAEQWRLQAGGWHWTLTALTALADQPEWGPALADVAATLRIDAEPVGPRIAVPVRPPQRPALAPSTGEYAAIARALHLGLGPHHDHPLRRHVVAEADGKLVIEDGDGAIRLDGAPATTTDVIRALIALHR